MTSVSNQASGPARFVACTAAVFALMLMPSALGLACQLGWLPLPLREVLLAASISADVVGSACLYSRLFTSS